MRSKVENWTDARFRAFIINALRAGFRRFPNKFEALKAAKIGRGINPKTKRECFYYKCSGCKGKFLQREVQVDHINPVVSSEGFTSWDNFIDNLFCDTGNLQVLCIGCHSIKTKEERRSRYATKQPTEKGRKKADNN